ELYHQRWHVELDIRVIKQTLKMDILSCKTPEMARKEVWAHLLAYDLVRRGVGQAARAAGGEQRQRGVAAGAAAGNALRWGVPHTAGGGRLPKLAEALLLAVSTHRVGQRPGRCEPRKVKRRPKGYPRMMKPRAQERAALLGRGR